MVVTIVAVLTNFAIIFFTQIEVRCCVPGIA